MNAEWAAPLMAELGRNSLQAAVLVLAVLLTQLALGRHLASRWRCALWLLVVVRLLVPFSVSSGASLFNLWPRSGEWFSSRLLSEKGESSTPKVASVPAAPPASEDGSEVTPVKTSFQPISHSSSPGTRDIPHVTFQAVQPAVAPAPYRRSSPSDEDPISEVQAGAQPAAVTAASSGAWPSWPLLLFWIWLTGVMALLGHVVISSLHLAQRFNRLQPFADPAVLALLEECCRKMGVSRRMTEHLVIVETVEVSTPALHGLLHPCLLLTRDFTRHFTPEELRFVFLHELAHLKRRDLWMGWIMAFLQALHWFNPLVWLAFARWRNDRELACDAMVLEAVGMQRKRDYGHTILKLLEKFAPPQRTPGLVGILENKDQLSQRIETIKAYVPAPRWSLLAAVLIASLAVVGLTDARTDDPGKTPSSTPPNKKSAPQLALELRDGSHVLGQSLDDPLRFHSDSLGDLKLPVAAISSIELKGNDPAESNDLIHLTATNGDVLDLRFATPTLPIKTDFGTSQLPVNAIRSIKITPPATPAGVQAGVPSNTPSSSVSQTSLSKVIQNPSFEVPFVGDVGKYYSYLQNPTNTGWIFIGTDIGNVGIGANGSAWNTYQVIGTTNGTQYAFLQGVGGVGASISQTLSNLTPGSYKFSFTAAQRDRVGRENITYQTTNQTVTVLVDGTNVGSFTPPDQNWYSYETAPVTLSPGDHTLTFTNLPVPGDASILLDNIGIKENKPDVAKAAPPKKGASPGELDSRLTIELLDGSRLLGKSQDDPILFHSAFLGDLKVPVAEISSVEFKGEGADGGGNAVLSAVNGDLLIGRFVSPSLSVETGFGKSALPVKMIRSIKVSHAAESAQAPPNFPAGLVALWKGDGSGADSTGTNNALVPEGVSYASTPVGEGFQFDGNSDGLSIPASPDLDVGTGPGFTLSCWAQPGSPTTRDPLLEWQQGTHLWISESGDIGVSKPGCVYANILDTLGNHHRFGSSTGLVQAGIPQQFALTYEKSSGMGSLYYNGKLVASQYLGSFTPKTDTALLIGERTVPEEVRYQGVINQISIFNRALSAEEIQALYAAENTKISLLQLPMKSSPRPALDTNFNRTSPGEATPLIDKDAQSALGATGLTVVMHKPAKPGWAPWDIEAQSRKLLLKKDFKGLDDLATALKAKGYDIRQDNKTEIEGFYEGFKLSDEDSDQAGQDRLALLEQWLAANPDSLSARIAIALWYIHSNLDSSDERAAKSLGSVPSRTPIDDPVYYQVWLKICLMQGRPKEEMFGYLRRCIALAKEYEPIYLDAGNFLSAQWYGDPGEREKWMKTWADSFPPEKGDLLYAFLLCSDVRNLGEATFKLDVDYDRAKNALQKRIVEDDPEWFHDENVLCHLAVAKNDNPLAKKLLFDLEGMVNIGFYADDTKDGSEYYRYLREYYGVDKGFDQAMDLERSGRLADAQKLLNSFTFHPNTYLPLAYFYEREGMRDPLKAMDYMVSGVPINDMIRTDISLASPEYLAELADYYPMMGDWDKAEVVAKRFDQLRPMNLIGKNILLLCAIRHHDSAGEETALREIVNLKTDRPVYRAAQAIVSGSQNSEQAAHSEALSKSDPYLSQGITTIALYYMMQGNNAQARAFIEQSLPVCTDNSGKTLLQSLLFGSLSYLTKPPSS